MHEQRQESDEEHQEDGDDAVLDPIEDGNEIVAARLPTENIALRVDLADRELLIKSTEVEN